MLQRLRSIRAWRLFAPLVAAVAWAGLSPASATAHPPSRSTASGATASAAARIYLRARTAALLPGAGQQDLRACFAPGSAAARRELLMARGARLSAATLGRRLSAARCAITVERVTATPGGATVTADVAVTTTWRDGAGRRGSEAAEAIHTVGLRLINGRWLVVSDAYFDDRTPQCLEAAGAGAAQVRAAGLRLERAGADLALPPAFSSPDSPSGSCYRHIFTYKRAAAAAYADRYWNKYNPTYAHFNGVDCANFASQTMFAGGFPTQGARYGSGWWYDKKFTSMPADDTWSHSWIAVPYQMAFWNTRYTDWATSIAGLNKGDFVYYDWTGDGSWDHAAEVVGVDASGQRLVDAHTTNRYHANWRMGSSATHYRFARVRATYILY
jgi:hypothetical protein